MLYEHTVFRWISCPLPGRLPSAYRERLAAMRAQRGGGQKRGSAPARHAASRPPARKPRPGGGGRGQNRLEAILDKHAPKADAPAQPFGRRRR